MKALTAVLAALFLLFVTAAFGQVTVTGAAASKAPGGGGGGTITIDGTPQTLTTGCVSTCAVTLTTSNSNDVIMVGVRIASGVGGEHPTTASVTASGLTFVKETAQLYQIGSNANGGEISIFSAVAAAPLSSVVVTANLNNTASSAARITAWGLAGADTSTIFDTNGSIPGLNAVTGATSIAPASVISTNCATTMLIGFVGGDSGLTSISRPSGFTQLLATGSVNDFSTKFVTSQQSSVTLTWSWTGSQGAGVIVSAVRASGC